METWKKLLIEEMKSLVSSISSKPTVLDCSETGECIDEELRESNLKKSYDTQAETSFLCEDELLLFRSRFPEEIVGFSQFVMREDLSLAVEESMKSILTPKPIAEALNVTVLPPIVIDSPLMKHSFPSAPAFPSSSSSEQPLMHQSRLVNSKSLPDFNGMSEESSYSFQHPFLASVTGAAWLTSPLLSQQTLTEGMQKESWREWGETKRVIGCTISIKDSGMSYQPGDSIGICCPNLPYAVSIVHHRLSCSQAELSSLSACIKILVGSGVEEIVTLEELLCFRYDLMGLPRKAAVWGSQPVL